MSCLPSGYGSQALALKYLGVPFEHWRTCEWAVKSIQAYKDIHFNNIKNEGLKFGSNLPERTYNILYSMGISQNYNEPMTLEQIKRLSKNKAEEILDNIHITNNLVNIQNIKAEQLEIIDTDKYDYVMTYSFPCQDLSLAGKGKGMSDTSTRSGMLWEVERILTECKELGTMPQVLLMENVPQVHSQDNMPDFHKWQVRLEELGYKSYWQDLIATDFGIPQTRNRCFMISILGDYSYTFPKPILLELKLKDMLEENVDEKYYLSDKMIKYISADNQKWTGNNDEALINKTYASTLNTNEGSRRCDASNYISEDVEENYNLKGIHKTLRETLENNEIKEEISYIDAYNRKIRDDNLSSTISTRVDASNNTYIAIKSATKKGYLKATDGDGIDISSRMEYHRGTVQKDKSQTLTTKCEVGICVGTYQYAKSDNFMQGRDRLQLGKEVSDTLQTTQKEGIVNSDLRIRKLTPRECGRLQGVKDSDITKLLSNQSDSSAYHCFGDAITVPVLCAIFGELLQMDYKSIIERWNYNE